MPRAPRSSTAGQLVSTSPATGAEAGRLPVATADDVRDAVARARAAGHWWAGLGFAGRRQRLLRWRALLAQRIEELAELMHAEGGKPVADAIVEIVTAIDHIDWAARNAAPGARPAPGPVPAACSPSSPATWNTSRTA